MYIYRVFTLNVLRQTRHDMEGGDAMFLFINPSIGAQRFRKENIDHLMKRSE